VPVQGGFFWLILASPSRLSGISDKGHGTVLPIIHRNDKNFKQIRGKWCKKAKTHFCVNGAEIEVGGDKKAMLVPGCWIPDKKMLNQATSIQHPASVCILNYVCNKNVAGYSHS
jgi:hypothetical protein